MYFVVYPLTSCSHIFQSELHKFYGKIVMQNSYLQVVMSILILICLATLILLSDYDYCFQVNRVKKRERQAWQKKERKKTHVASSFLQLPKAGKLVLFWLNVGSVPILYVRCGRSSKFKSTLTWSLLRDSSTKNEKYQNDFRTLPLPESQSKGVRRLRQKIILKEALFFKP